MPDEEPTVAIAVLLLVHEPPDGVELSVVVVPTHNVAVPVMADGLAITQNGKVTKQLPNV